MAFFLVPLVFSNILQSASGTINSVFIGRLIGVDGLAGEPAGHLALEVVGGGEESRVRSTEAQRHAETLRGADHHVRPHRAGRLQ